MARIRTIKPQFFTNEDLAELSYGDRLLFVGLWTAADKGGRLEDRPKRLKAALFPYDDFDVDEGLGRLANAKFIERYDGNRQRLIQIRTWDKHQRPHHTEPESEYPPPPSDHGDQTVINGTEGKGKEGNKEMIRSIELGQRFQRFWAVYPRKVAKDGALAVWNRLQPTEDLTTQMIAAVRRQAQSEQWQDEKYIPHPRTWLNQGRWKDQLGRPLGPALPLESPVDHPHLRKVAGRV